MDSWIYNNYCGLILILNTNSKDFSLVYRIKLYTSLDNWIFYSKMNSKWFNFVEYDKWVNIWLQWILDVLEK